MVGNISKGHKALSAKTKHTQKKVKISKGVLDYSPKYSIFIHGSLLIEISDRINK